ncbi:hypothetical protein KY358_00360 [Candidatus Woesearchaeota archaeon]|nr:hypothetical protein [Candidatus Woesearchaeota archaeon]
MAKAELFVGLKIPDTTAITALNTIKRMGYPVEKLKRQLYYSFDIEGDLESFRKKIGKTDILVNANKNTHSTKLEKKKDAVYILVKDTGDSCSSLLKTLHSLGLKGIRSMEKGVLWELHTDKETAIEIADKLLYNENYQEIEVL